MKWQDDKIYLRLTQLSDVPFLLELENNPVNWEVSDTFTPYSEEEMVDFIVDQQDFTSNNQLRLMICLRENNNIVGAIDLFEIENSSAKVGVIIYPDHCRRLGIASRALELLKLLAQELYHLNKLTCTVQRKNDASAHLFRKSGFSLDTFNKEQGIDSYVIKL